MTEIAVANMASAWLMPLDLQCRAACCPCFVVEDMADSVGGCGALGCLACCVGLFPCVLAPLGRGIAEKSGIEESLPMACVKATACTPFYFYSLLTEYQKQKRYEGGKANDVSRGQWVVTVPELLRAQCLPFLVGRDMYRHIGGSAARGAACSLLCSSCCLWEVGPEIASRSGVDVDGVCFHVCCFGQCYARSVYTEYMYQRNVKPEFLSGLALVTDS